MNKSWLFAVLLVALAGPTPGMVASLGEYLPGAHGGPVSHWQEMAAVFAQSAPTLGHDSSTAQLAPASTPSATWDPWAAAGATPPSGGSWDPWSGASPSPAPSEPWAAGTGEPASAATGVTNSISASSLVHAGRRLATRLRLPSLSRYQQFWLFLFVAAVLVVAGGWFVGRRQGPPVAG